MTPSVQNLVELKLQTFLDDLGLTEKVTPETRIFGGNAKMNSVQFVAFVADLEEALFETFATEVSLVNEKALSMSKSPFRDVSTMSQYIESLLP